MSIAITVTGQTDVYTKMHDALAVAAAGDTVTVTMADNDILTGGNNDNGFGTQLYFTVSGGTVAENSAAMGGAFYLMHGGTLTATNVLFSGNTGVTETNVWNGGGAISGGTTAGSTESLKTHIYLTDVTFSGNSVKGSGGAVLSFGSGKFTNVTFTGNTSSRAGGALIHREYTLTMKNVSFTGNRSLDRGGAIYMMNGAIQISADSGKRNTFSGNTGTFGGAIGFNQGDSTVDSADFSNNCATTANATYGGGAIFIANGAQTVTNSTFTGNTAAAYGGAIRNNKTLTLTNAYFSGNTATLGGNAIYNASGATLHLSGGTFATALDTVENAGTLNVSGTNLFDASLTGTGTINVTNAALIFGNTESIDVAGLTFSGSNTLKFTGSAAVNFTGQDFSGVTLLIDNSVVHLGETVTVATGVADVDTVTFTCFADEFDYDLTAGTLTYTVPAELDAGITVSSVPDTAYLTMEAALAAAQTGDTVTVTLGENNVLSGGVNDNGAGQTLNYVVTGGTVANNIATLGGFVQLAGASTSIDASGVLFYGNTSTYSTAGQFAGGGAISAGPFVNKSYETVTIANSTFTRNYSAAHGGALTSAGSISVTDSEFNYNYAASHGGAMFFRQNDPPLRSLSGVSFTGNTARYGGAIGIYLGSPQSILGSSGRNVFTNNVAMDDGGAIWVNLGNLNITATDFIGNTAARYGGAIHYIGDTLTLSDVTFSGNTAVNTGGAIYNTKTVRINGDVSFLTASDTIYNTGTLTVTGTNYFNASVTGTGTINVNNSTMIFGNSEAISVAALTLSGNNAMAFNGAAAVNFASQDLSDVAVTVDASVYAGSEITVATGVTGFGGYTLTGTDNAALFLKVEDSSLVLYERTADLADGQTETNFVGGTANLITGGTVTAAFFGTRKNSFGSVRTVFTGGTVANSMVGGALVQAKDTENTALDAVMLDIHNGVSLLGGPSNGGMNYVAGYAYGRSDWTALPGSANYTVGEAVLNLSGSSISGNLYAGAHARKYAYTNVAATTVNVTGGTVEKLYGGGWAERGDKSITGGTVAKSDVGTATVNISGGSINRLYAGGGNSLYGYTNVGTANLTISGGTVDFVFLGGRNNNCFVDNATLTITGDAQTLTRVSGKTDSGVDNTTGTAALNVQTNVTLGYLDYVDTINIAEACTLNITELVLYDDISQELSVYLGTDGFDDVWTLLSAGDTTYLDLLSTAQFFVNNTACAMGGSVDIGGDSYRLDKSGLGITLSKIS